MNRAHNCKVIAHGSLLAYKLNCCKVEEWKKKIRLLCEIKLIWESFRHFIPLKTIRLVVSGCVWHWATFTMKGKRALRLEVI